MSEPHTSLKQLEIPSDPNQLLEVDRFFEELFERENLSEELHGNVSVSISEAVNNAILHGNKSDLSKLVRLNVNLDENKLAIEVIDQGSGFDYDNLPDPTAPENLEKETGRGIFIIRNLSDELEFEDEGRIMRMHFSLK